MTDGLITVASAHSFSETLARFEAALLGTNMTVFARVDHAGGAAAAGLSLRPTMLILFGNPRGGTPLMQAAQPVGLELPLKMLVWEDEGGATQLSYDDPVWLARRFGLDLGLPSVKTLSSALADLASMAAKP
jgi:uncharacterized protein (DUF302 family)